MVTLPLRGKRAPMGPCACVTRDVAARPCATHTHPHACARVRDACARVHVCDTPVCAQIRPCARGYGYVHVRARMHMNIVPLSTLSCSKSFNRNSLEHIS